MSVVEQQLLENIKDIFPDFKITLQDLRNPTEDFVTDFYTYWLHEFEVDISNIVQTQFNQTHAIGGHLDAFSGIIPKTNLLKCVRYFDVVADFGILDIISPTPRRTQNIIKSCLDFYYWADYRVVGLVKAKKSKGLRERKQKILEMMKDREDLKQSINDTLISIAHIQDSKKQMEEKVLQLQQKIIELRLEKEVVRAEVENSNEKLKESENTLQKVNKEEFQITNKMKEYSNQIVDSPTTILTDLNSLRLKCKEINELSDQKRDMVEVKMVAHKKLQEAVSDQQQREQQLQELLKIIEKYSKLQQVVSELEKNTVACQEELTELNSLLMAQRNKKNTCQDALQSLYLKWKTSKSQLTESIEAALRELNEKKNAKNEMIDSLKEDAAVQEKIISLMKKIKNQCEDVTESYKNLMNQDNEYIGQIETRVISNTKRIKTEAKKKYNLK